MKFHAASLIMLLVVNTVTSLYGQTGTGTISGKVTEHGKPLPFANVGLAETKHGTTTDEDGSFRLIDVPFGTYRLQVAFLGFKTWTQEITIGKGNSSIEINPTLVKTTLELNEMVVTGTRTEKRRLDSAVPVNILDSRILESTQSLNLAEGLAFQPGIRVEKDCQTCNYTQVRMNGLTGSYTQILLNSKPLFSSLAGLYGLEQLPASMIERVEIVRGGGSVLYGSNAIAGTINIITRDPVENGFSISSNAALVNGDAHDFQNDLDATLLSDSKRTGATIMLSHRDRESWDANGDGFSELSKIENLSLGLAGFIKTSKSSNLRLSLNNINEIRNGGDQLQLEPHKRMQSEFRDSKIITGNIDYSIDLYKSRSRIDIYTGGQITLREHYTGAFGADGYGVTDNRTLVAGIQMNHTFLDFINGNNLVTLGFDYQSDKVFDEIKAYNYLIDQETFQSGVFLQSDWDLHKKINLLTGIRVSFNNKAENPFAIPRIALLYKINSKTQLRLSYAKGYRAPQAFDTDMHIAFAGGGVAITRMDPQLKSETSSSYTGSIDYNVPHEKYIFGFTLTGFQTHLQNTFVLIEEPTTGINSSLLRTNGSDATVKGMTLEGRVNYNYQYEIDLGWTLQQSYYDDLMTWSLQSKPLTEFLRTPSSYGYFVATWTLNKIFKTSFSGVYTGPMTMLHLAGSPETMQDTIVESDGFLELNFKLEYQLMNKKNRYRIYINGGVQNITNAYQADFDTGPSRDSNYVYGPGRPRTFFAGLRIDISQKEQ